MSHEIEFIASPNYGSRPSGIVIDTIVIHYTASMNINGTISWFNNPESKVSAHYLIGRDGRIVQMVQQEDKAWHAGKSEWQGRKNVNKFSIGIELVGTKDSGFTDEQYDATAFLVSKIQKEYGFIFECVGHSDIAPGRKIDPGEHWDWNKFENELINYESSVDQESQEIFDPSETFEDDKDSHIPEGKDEPENWFEKLVLEILKALGIELNY
ncbi:MAG: 1,6-anhydro-N-acetylmuramyl-L-alanine amidase AmpD [Petrotogales bacterium]